MADVRLLTPDGASVLELRWDGNRTRIEAGGDLAGAVLRWERAGLVEWVGDPLFPRRTRVTDPEFAERLASYLKRHYGFVASSL